MLKEVDYLIIEEYFLNGFNKPKAFKKYKNNYKTQNSFNNANCLFWQKQEVKDEIKRRLDMTLGEREELIDELLFSLKDRVFNKEVDEFYSYSNKQKDIDLLIKISGIDKAPKFEPKAQQIEPVIIELGMLED